MREKIIIFWIKIYSLTEKNTNHLTAYGKDSHCALVKYIFFTSYSLCYCNSNNQKNK